MGKRLELLDEFAKAAMQGIMASVPHMNTHTAINTIAPYVIDQLSDRAYQIAVSMLRTREDYVEQY